MMCTVCISASEVLRRGLPPYCKSGRTRNDSAYSVRDVVRHAEKNLCIVRYSAMGRYALGVV